MASRQLAGTDTSTAAFQRKRTRAAFEMSPAMDACFTDGRPRRDALSDPGDDLLTEAAPIRFAQ